MTRKWPTRFKKLMFVFEDLTSIDDTAMREILKKVEGQQLTFALKTATEEMKDKDLLQPVPACR